MKHIAVRLFLVTQTRSGLFAPGCGCPCSCKLPVAWFVPCGSILPNKVKNKLQKSCMALSLTNWKGTEMLCKFVGAISEKAARKKALLYWNGWGKQGLAGTQGMMLLKWHSEEKAGNIERVRFSVTFWTLKSNSPGSECLFRHLYVLPAHMDLSGSF